MIFKGSSINYSTLFIFLFLSISFHNFQRLSIIYLLVPFSLYFLLSFSLDLLNFKIHKKNIIYFFYVFFIFYSIFLIFYSIPISGGATFIGMIRYFFTPLIALFAVNTVKSELTIRKLLNYYILIIFIAALTIPLQFIIGPISWFSDAATRGGAYRFSTLLGNLTAIGIAGGIGLTMVLLYERENKIIRYILIFGIAIGMSMSMQRAGVMNIIISYIIYFILSSGNWVKKLRLLSSILTLSVILFIIAYNIEFSRIYLSFFMNSLGIDSGIQTRVDYSPFYDQIFYRLFGNTLTHINYYGPVWLIIGYGFAGFGGVLGMEGLYAHNDFLNMLTIGGVIYLLFFIFFLAFLLVKNIDYFQRSGNDISKNNLRVLLGSLIIFIINLPMGSGNFLHPNHSLIFWFSVGLFSGFYFNKYSKYKQI